MIVCALRSRGANAKQGSKAAARTRVIAEAAYAGVGKSGFGGMCGPLLELFSVLSLALLPGDSGSREAAEIRKKKQEQCRDRCVCGRP